MIFLPLTEKSYTRQLLGTQVMKGGAKKGSAGNPIAGARYSNVKKRAKK